MSPTPFNQALSQSDPALKFAQKLRKIACAHANRRLDNHKQASNKTIKDAIDHAERIGRILWGLGYMLREPDNLGEKHVKALMQYVWQCHPNAGTFSVWMTQVGKLTTWLGKPGLLKSASHYVPENELALVKRKASATKSKSPVGLNISDTEIIKRASAVDERFCAMVRLILAFGLRRKEVLMLRPHVDDRTLYLDIRAGTAKGTRTRLIPIECDEQRAALAQAKELLGVGDFMGWPETGVRTPGRSLFDANNDRFQYFMKKAGLTKDQLGITAHGMRAGYAERRAIEMGFVPPTRQNGATLTTISRDQEKLVRLRVAEELGHSRVSVTGSYYGSSRSVLGRASPSAPSSQMGVQLGSVADLHPSHPEEYSPPASTLTGSSGITVIYPCSSLSSVIRTGS